MGQPAVAVSHSRQVIAFYHTHRPNLTSDDAFDLALNIASSLGLSLVPLGYPDEALRQAQEGLALVERYEHPLGIASCLGLVSAIHFMRGEWAAALKFGKAQRDVSTTHNLDFVRTYGEMHEGSALAMLGEVDAGLALTRQAITERRKLGISHSHAYSFTALAKACGRAGRVTEGLSLINEALYEIDNNNDRQFESKSYQVKGDLLLLQTLADDQWAIAQQEAETCLLRAIEIAQNRQAKLREARALSSLCRLHHSQGRDEGYRQQLADLYAWFTEGFETEDLRVVQAVLEEIS
jgi:pentatricopeptide repeat protein